MRHWDATKKKHNSKKFRHIVINDSFDELLEELLYNYNTQL